MKLWNYKTLAPRKKSYDKPWQNIKKQRHYFSDKDPCSQRCGFSNSHVWMWELEHKEGWLPKNGCFWTMVPEKTVESSLECKKTKPLNPEGNPSWIFIGRTDVEVFKLQYFGHLMRRADSLKKTLTLWKTEGRKRRGDRGCDGWTASPTQWTWGGETYGRWWRTGKPRVLQSMGLQRAGHNWATEQQQHIYTSIIIIKYICSKLLYRYGHD